MNDIGLGVETDCALELNAVLIIKGNLSHDGAISKARARVVRTEAIPGGYRSGLALESGPGKTANPAKRSRIITRYCKSAPMPTRT